ncbi:hypothetical protein MPTK1_3g10840 [Marchantia polymorpha subsp. ruderalis]|uniref:Protein RESISTANCE TO PHYTOPHTHORA 1, chloroplastic n=2 Tax=Marchantia polymorpha TaxID=3197 RepID=A0A176VN60_MARPO|nr:hypothetical protein AXG93_3658s1170 [Marchantia polymorpha subsp. ruderalis]PTQ40943.1 hypothetical protein MARPO_0037s0112 [Marchantia polymorpha]BBN05161.1 hypothetical protein Mp_3g10840 [Marchantia polymorpha subsp. ruderalis]|eukprot:PTQ40943.1 hypothetical protein MARPO_0037s0112 [Marchantia polymorpha]
MAAVSAAAATVGVCSGVVLCPEHAVLRKSSCSWPRAAAAVCAPHGTQLQLAAAASRHGLTGFARSTRRRNVARASSQPKTEIELQQEEETEPASAQGAVDDVASTPSSSSAPSSPGLQKELNKAVSKTAATFAPRASTASKNPAVPGSTLYKVFESQAYVSMVVGGALSFNLLFPSDQADIWRLMGMWSIWMFTIPSLRARDCSKKEKEALNYLFLLVPLINVTLPIFWKSFAAVWSADVVAFFAMYAWKMEWLSDAKKVDE